MTDPSRSSDSANRRGKDWRKHPRPDQSSAQKRKDSPDPSRGWKKGWTAWKTALREDMNAESPLLGVYQICQSSVVPYSSLNTVVTKSPMGWSSQQTHLDRRIVLVCSNCRTPKPPWSTGRHTISHATRATPWDSSGREPSQKKPLISCSSRLRTPTGILKMVMK